MFVSTEGYFVQSTIVKIDIFARAYLVKYSSFLIMLSALVSIDLLILLSASAFARSFTYGGFET